MEININTKIQVEEKPLTGKKEDLKKASFQQKLVWEKIKEKLSENTEAMKRSDY
jgi:hypothetical protein